MNFSARQPLATSRVLALIGTLYVSQGIPMGLAFIALPAILRTQGAEPKHIGLLGLILIPWAIKFLWAPYVDRLRGGWLGPRRSWIAPAQVLLATIYLVIALLPAIGSDFRMLLGFLLLANFVSATQDIATDGFAVEALGKLDLGWANGLQIGGFSLGMILGGTATVLAYEHSGWQVSFIVLAALTFLTLIPVLLISEPEETSSSPASARPRASFANFIRRPGAYTMLFIAATFYFGTTMVSSMKGVFLIDAGLSITQVGIIGGIGSATISIAGALLGSLLVHRFGAKSMAIICGAIAAASLSLWLLPARAQSIDFISAVAVTSLIGIATGTAYVAFFTLFMAWASPEQAGTDFTLLQCTESLTNIGASILAGLIAQHWGFQGLFAAAPIIALAIIAAIARLLATCSSASGAHANPSIQ